MTQPFHRPYMPKLADIQPYFEQIDQNGMYTNNGPLVQEFEKRLSQRWDGAHVCCVSSGTMGLYVATIAMGLNPGARVAIPSWTFPATPEAVIAAGQTPHFCDVEQETWALSPKSSTAISPDLIMPVAPFGAPLDLEAWEAIDIPVIIDAAAGFEAFKPSKIPQIVSLHATKIFGIGEGGLIVSTDSEFMATIRRLINFGHDEKRHIRIPGINGKLSEYQAAVGLAALDNWPETRKLHYDLAKQYAPIYGPYMQPGFGTDWVSASLTCVDPSRDGDDIMAAIGARRWWTQPCHHHDAFAHYPREAMDNTEFLHKHSFGVPFYPGVQLPVRKAS
ncbi:MAG: DegT/DnrJ/EryC1/StrS family aminotransferase [Alphaproteobacteria bacterium]